MKYLCTLLSLYTTHSRVCDLHTTATTNHFQRCLHRVGQLVGQQGLEALLLGLRNEAKLDEVTNIHTPSKLEGNRIQTKGGIIALRMAFLKDFLEYYKIIIRNFLRLSSNSTRSRHIPRAFCFGIKRYQLNMIYSVSLRFTCFYIIVLQINIGLDCTTNLLFVLVQHRQKKPVYF